jgi:tetratricopeptide (TPR) repeat protein
MKEWNAKLVGRQTETGDTMGKMPPSGRKNLKAAMEAGREHFSAGRYDEAIEAFETILLDNPDAAPAYVGLGNVHARKGDYKEALAYYEGALHLKKDLVPALLMSGNVYMRQGDFARAIEMYKKALAVNPGLDRARLGMGGAYAKMGMFDKAIECTNEALQYNPQFEQARLALAKIYLEQGDNEAALRQLQGILSREPQNISAHLQIARVFTAKNDFQGAVETLKKAVSIEPDNARILCVLGKCYMSAKEYELAAEAYAKAAERDPALIGAKIGKVRALMELERLEEAKTILSELSKGGKRVDAVHRMLAELFVKQGNYADAVVEYKAAVLNSMNLVEKHPELAAITAVPGDDKATAKLYRDAFEKADAEDGNDEDSEEREASTGNALSSTTHWSTAS